MVSAAELDRYWPYVDNVWSRKESNPSGTTDYFRCRAWRKESHGRAGMPSGRPRNSAKMTHNAVGCGMKLTVSRLADGTVSLRRADTWVDQVDTLRDADRKKAPSVFRAEAARRITGGESVASVARSLRGFSDSRVRFVSRGRCRNAGDAWLRAHPDQKRRYQRAAWELQREEARIWLDAAGSWESANLEVRFPPLAPATLTIYRYVVAATASSPLASSSQRPPASACSPRVAVSP